jgi:hypothetical protein
MAYQYMPFPSKRLEMIPANPAKEFHARAPMSFMTWVKNGLDNPFDDLEVALRHALERFEQDGQWIPRTSRPVSSAFPSAMRDIGKIQVKNVVEPGQRFNIARVDRAQSIISQVKLDANRLLGLLIQMTYRLYLTEVPWAGWPALLRAAARGWALV